MRDAIERQRRERRLAAIIFALLLGITALAEGWRATRSVDHRALSPAPSATESR